MKEVREKMDSDQNSLNKHDEDHLESYADGSILSADAKIPKWIIIVIIVIHIWGILWFYLFWNGSHGWLDRGYWGQLQKAANTTYIKNTPYYEQD